MQRGVEMFEGFARVWSPLAPVKAIRRGPLRVVLAGEPIVLFQDRTGAIGALIDRCPHRGVALSLGRVGADGCLECPFHGWRFNVDGVNRRTPLNPQARREGLSAQALPVRRLGDYVWVYTEPGAAAPPEPVAPEGLTAAGLSSGGGSSNSMAPSANSTTAAVAGFHTLGLASNWRSIASTIVFCRLYFGL